MTVMRGNSFLISTWTALFRPSWLYFGFSLQLNFQCVPKKKGKRKKKSNQAGRTTFPVGFKKIPPELPEGQLPVPDPGLYSSRHPSP